ncbi:aminoacyl-tRNA hydrolase [Patescibacteria group bacterium]|nr:aminoacyl-tRNA hydrolase [Patescibacteria group bacterium]MBU1868526.1 aminoacyl-tRNA hydrolase [Patescibacteria group bacterium]
MFLIVGLGNPGEKYNGTRHNVGHWLIDRLRAEENFNSDTFLIKTDVFMNSSGGQVKILIDKYKVSLNNLVVLHDDLDISLGEFRLQRGRSAAGHKGIESIIQVLGDSGFWRFRVGIGRPPEGVESEDYVLRKFSKRELQTLENLLPEVERNLLRFPTQKKNTI